MLRVLLALLILVEGHVSFVVRDVTGTRQLLRLKVGHAENGMFTRSLTVRIPNGVLSAKAVTLGGWTVSTTTRPLGGLSFSNGHNAVTEVADTITWTDENLSNENVDDWELALFELEVQFGCNFTDTTTSTDYNGQKAVWFPTVQGIANSFKPTQTDVLSWETIPDNAPYVNLKAWASCPNGVLNWLGLPFTSPTPPLYLTETEVQARIDTAMRSGSLYTDNTRDIAIAALVFGVLGFIFGAIACGMIAMTMLNKSGNDGFKKQVDA